MPVEEVVRWFNQPVIRDYIQMKQRAKSVSAALTNTDYDTGEIIGLLGKKYGFDFLPKDNRSLLDDKKED